MNPTEYPSNKVYYSIGEVSKMIEVPITHLRLWEKEFDLIRPKKNRKGDRFFTVTDIENLKVIKHLIRERGFKLQGAKKILMTEFKAAKGKQEALETLNNVRSFLVSLRDAIDQRINKPASAKKETS